MKFPSNIDAILQKLEAFNPSNYAASRNYHNGSVSYLSPYISRGVISTKVVFNHVKSLDLPWYTIKKFVQELAWRDYWQQLWNSLDIDKPIKQTQFPVRSNEIPQAILHQNTGISAVDQALKSLTESGYMHNHMRMYVASICCNYANCDWLSSSKWMFSQLLDGDQGSNQLSWQWVAGSNSNKKYYANQQNINKFFNSTQTGTFLDVPYEAFPLKEIPKCLSETSKHQIQTMFPQSSFSKLTNGKKTLIYNYYNLDPFWHKNEKYQRVLLLEPSFFKDNPVNKNCIDFALQLAQNIDDIIVFSGEFNQLQKHIPESKIIYKQHPTVKHYSGTEESRDWLSDVEGVYPTFFKFWNKAEKQLKY